MTKKVIGIMGTIGAGKDKASDYIASQLNIPSFQISSPLKQICEDTGIEPTRHNLIALGTKLAAEHGDGFLADPIIRFERVKNNGKLGEAKTLKEFIAREKIENSAPNAQRLFECMELADYHVLNEGSLKELYARLDEIITE